MSSPLGQYAAPVAAGVVGLLVVADIVALLFGVQLHIDPNAAATLDRLATLAVGAALGSAVAVNGYKAPLAALGQRVDQHSTAIQTIGTIAAEAHPAGAPAIAAAIERTTDTPTPAPSTDAIG